MNSQLIKLLSMVCLAAVTICSEAASVSKTTKTKARNEAPTFLHDLSRPLNSDTNETKVTARAASVGVNFNFDVLGIANSISASISSAQNRDAFVKNLANTAFYAAQSKYHVMVFNLNVAHSHGLEGVKSYGSASYDGIIYGIWVFEKGWFHNQGDGGYINWAFIGWFHREGGYVSFH